MPLKKIIMLAYFFPPANFAGSYRVGSWARHLHKFGYYPIIVTRCWNKDQTTTTEAVINNTLQHEKYDTYEVYRIPYHSNLRDRLHARYGDSKFTIIRKALTLLELLLQNFGNAVIPYHNLYDFALQLLESHSVKKWLRSAALFTTRSDDWVKQISAYTGRAGRVVLNGYEDNIMAHRHSRPASDTLTIVHDGTIYSSQPTEIIFRGL